MERERIPAEMSMQTKPKQKIFNTQQDSSRKRKSIPTKRSDAAKSPDRRVPHLTRTSYTSGKKRNALNLPRSQHSRHFHRGKAMLNKEKRIPTGKSQERSTRKK